MADLSLTIQGVPLLTERLAERLTVERVRQVRRLAALANQIRKDVHFLNLANPRGELTSSRPAVIGKRRAVAKAKEFGPGADDGEIEIRVTSWWRGGDHRASRLLARRIERARASARLGGIRVEGGPLRGRRWTNVGGRAR